MPISGESDGCEPMSVSHERQQSDSGLSVKTHGTSLWSKYTTAMNGKDGETSQHKQINSTLHNIPQQAQMVTNYQILYSHDKSPLPAL